MIYFCSLCGQYLSTATTYHPGKGCINQSHIVKNHRMSPVSWEDAKRNDQSPIYKITDISIYDEKHHLVCATKVRRNILFFWQK